MSENIVNGQNYNDNSLSSGIRYYYRVMARGINAYSHWAYADGVTPIITPVTPNVTASTTGNSTTWSWPTIVCSAGTINYQYRYTINNGYDSGWKVPSAMPIVQTTNYEGYTYTISVQAKCSTAYTSSPWSGIGAASYYRPYTLTLVAGTGGTVSGAGSYNGGASVTIAAMPKSGYIFNSWSGDTGCSGAASHAIVMNGAKTCTANFVLNTYTLSLSAGAGGTVSGGGTYTSGTSVTITATPWSGYSFSGWSGSTGCSGAASHTVTIDTAKTCTAYFSVNRSTVISLYGRSQAQSTTISLSNLASIRSITANNGYVSSYGQSGNNVIINVNGGAASTGIESGPWSDTLYNKYYSTTNSSTVACSLLPSYITKTLSDGYSGRLNHQGSSCTIASTIDDSKNVTITDTAQGSLYPVTSTYNYTDSSGYSGTLSRTGWGPILGYSRDNYSGICAYEDGWCNFNGQRNVRFGDASTDRWVYKVFTNGANCTRAAFDGQDPAYGVVKGCQYFIGSSTYSSPPGNPIQHPVYSGTVYKYKYTYTGIYSGTLYKGGYTTQIYTYYPYTVTINYTATY